MRKSIFLITIIISICVICNITYASTITNNNLITNNNNNNNNNGGKKKDVIKDKNFDFAEDGNYDISKTNILTITLSLARIAGLICFVIGTIKLFMGYTDNNPPEEVAGGILMVLGILGMTLLPTLKLLGVLKQG